jgi:uncharacterized protein YbjQ (UPF0145 family)
MYMSELKKTNDQEPEYDPKLISTSTSYDTTKFKQLGVVVGSATQGISLSKTFFSGLRAMVGSRVTNIEDSFTRGFGFAIQHMLKNAQSQFPNFKKIIGLFWTMTALNPEAISIMVTGTAIGDRKQGGRSKTNKKRRVFKKSRKNKLR